MRSYSNRLSLMVFFANWSYFRLPFDSPTSGSSKGDLLQLYEVDQKASLYSGGTCLALRLRKKKLQLEGYLEQVERHSYQGSPLN